MADINKLAPFIQKWEGGYVDHPLDRGGATNMGVTIATYTDYRRAKGISHTSKEDLRHMTISEWSDIFKTRYWDRWQGDKLRSQSVANLLVDWVWGSGRWGIILPQRLLGVVDDGLVGSRTLAAVNAHARPREKAQALFERLREAKAAYYHSLVRKNPSQEIFLRGWLNRLDDLRFTDR